MEPAASVRSPVLGVELRGRSTNGDFGRPALDNLQLRRTSRMLKVHTGGSIKFGPHILSPTPLPHSAFIRRVHVCRSQVFDSNLVK